MAIDEEKYDDLVYRPEKDYGGLVNLPYDPKLDPDAANGLTPLPGPAKSAGNFTNRPEYTMDENKEGWQIPGYMNIPTTGEQPEYAPGADEDKRLGMNPQGGWTKEKMNQMFPGMFLNDYDMLDPAEQAKKEAGMPYDAKKRFKSDPNWRPAGEGGISGGMPLPDKLRMSRVDFADHVIKNVIKFDPFGLDPYKEMDTAFKAGLQDFFEQEVFPGYSYTDLGRLSKEEMAYWQQMIKVRRGELLNEAKSKKETALAQYNNIMNMWEKDHKESMAQFANDQMEDALAKAKATGQDQTVATYNNDGKQTVKIISPSGKVKDTGKGVGKDAITNADPDEIKQMRAILKQWDKEGKGLDPMLGLALARSNMGEEEKKAFMEAAMPTSGLPPAQREYITKIRDRVFAYDMARGVEAMRSLDQKQQAQAQGQQAQQTQAPVERYIAAIMAAKKKGVDSTELQRQLYSVYGRQGADALQQALKTGVAPQGANLYGESYNLEGKTPAAGAGAPAAGGGQGAPVQSASGIGTRGGLDLPVTETPAPDISLPAPETSLRGLTPEGEGASPMMAENKGKGFIPEMVESLGNSPDVAEGPPEARAFSMESPKPGMEPEEQVNMMAKNVQDTGPASLEGKTFNGFEVRKPSKSELKFFKENPDTTGYAAEDGKIVLNPNTELTPQQLQAVAMNESIRLYMRENDMSPDFKVTAEQKAKFKGTAYEKDEKALKETIVARILTGDTADWSPTPEQRAWAQSLKSRMSSRLVSKKSPTVVMGVRG